MKGIESAHPLSLIAKVLIHGLLLLFLAPAVDWVVWFFIVLGVAALHGGGDVARRFLPLRVVRTTAIAYSVFVTLPVLASWMLILFYSPGLWLAIGLATAWLVWLLWLRLDSLAAMFGAALIAVAVLLPTQIKGSSLLVMSLVGVSGLTIFLAAAFADRFRDLGRVLIALFVLLAMAMGANDVFYQAGAKVDITTSGRQGVLPIYQWDQAPPSLRNKLGTGLRFVEFDPFGRMIIGTQNGVFLASRKDMSLLPVGPAGDNAGVDEHERRVYLATRDGKLSLLEGAATALSKQIDLPHGALVTRVAPEGVYVLDEINWVGLYDKGTLTLKENWSRLLFPVCDLQPDGEGGFFLSSLTGRVEHHRAEGAVQRASVCRLGLFHLMALDQENKRLFVGNMAAKTISVFSTDDLSLINELATDRGVRNLHWDAETNTLLAGSYFRGEVIAYRGRTELREIGRLPVGRRVRTIAPGDPGTALVASGGGLFALSLDPVRGVFAE